MTTDLHKSFTKNAKIVKISGSGVFWHCPVRKKCSKNGHFTRGFTHFSSN